MFGSGTLNHGKMLLVTKLELDLGLMKIIRLMLILGQVE